MRIVTGLSPGNVFLSGCLPSFSRTGRPGLIPAVPGIVLVIGDGRFLRPVPDRLPLVLGIDMEVIGVQQAGSSYGETEPDVDRSENQVFVFDAYADADGRVESVFKQIAVVAENAEVGESVQRETKLVQVPWGKYDGQ